MGAAASARCLMPAVNSQRLVKQRAFTRVFGRVGERGQGPGGTGALRLCAEKTPTHALLIRVRPATCRHGALRATRRGWAPPRPRVFVTSCARRPTWRAAFRTRCRWCCCCCTAPQGRGLERAMRRPAAAPKCGSVRERPCRLARGVPVWRAMRPSFKARTARKGLRRRASWAERRCAQPTNSRRATQP